MDAVVSRKITFSGLKNRWYGLASTGMMSLASQGINSTNNFATGIIMGRHCPKEEFGLYALGLSLVLLIIDLQTTFISTPYIIYGPRLHVEERRRYAGSTFLHQMSFAAFVAILLLCGLGAVSAGLAPEGFRRVLETLAAAVFFIMLKDFFRQMCFASLNAKAAFLLDSASALIQVCCLLLLAYRGALSANKAFLIAGLACGSASTGWLFMNRNMFAVELKRVLPDLRQKWPLVKWLLASQLLWTSAMGLYPWFIAAFHGVRENGIWAACQSIIAIGNLVSLAAQNLLGPKLIHVLARDGVMKMRAMILKAGLLMALIMSLFCIICILFGSGLMVLFFGRAYDGYGLVVAILAVNLAVSSLTYPFSRGLFALERADADFKINVAVVLSLLPGVWLVHAFGVAGAAFGLLVANTLSVLLRGITFNRIALAVTAPTRA